MFTRIGGVLEQITGRSFGYKNDSHPLKKLKVSRNLILPLLRYVVFLLFLFDLGFCIICVDFVGMCGMGLSKELDEAEVPLDKLTSHGNQVGSLGWQAPEKLIKESRRELEGKGYLAADIFSLGCVLYYCITGGEHPYGSEDKPWERETNIAKGNRENMKVEHESMSPDLCF